MSLTDEIFNLARIFFPTFSTKCTHDRIRPDIEQAYCPDCGVKMKAICKNGEIIPQNHYCSNCGSEEFSVEKIEKINFIDINFAVLVKQEIEDGRTCNITKCWQEKTPELLKLPVKYL